MKPDKDAMNEPIYTYVRGKGWQIDCAESVRIFFNATRQWVTIYNRKPELGEYHTHPIGKGSPVDLENRDFQSKCNWLASCGLTYMRYHEKSWAWSPDSFVYTLVPDE